MLALAWLIACGGGAGRIHEEEPVEPLRGDGWAVMVPVGAVVERTDAMLQVDAPDGRSWFDVAWVDEPATHETALRWGRGVCAPVLFDRGWTDGRRYAAGGICEISSRRHWVLVVLEPAGGRTLQTAFLADARRMPYEDAWVAFARTALTLGPGPEPLGAPDVDALRERVRAAGLEEPGPIPVPGGGLLSTRILPQLTDVWTARDGAPPTPGSWATPD